MIVRQIHHDNPFRDLGAMDSVCRTQGNLGIREDRVFDNKVDACGEELNEFDIRNRRSGRRKPEECAEIGSPFDEV